jgi:hypothetical protein
MFRTHTSHKQSYILITKVGLPKICDTSGPLHIVENFGQTLPQNCLHSQNPKARLEVLFKFRIISDNMNAQNFIKSL